MMRKLGLRSEDLVAIGEVLSKFPSVEQAQVFGSRAKGNYKPGSDVDLALKGPALSLDDISRISCMLNEETLMPYRFDVLQYETISSADLVEHIDRVGVVIYSLAV